MGEGPGGWVEKWTGGDSIEWVGGRQEGWEGAHERWLKAGVVGQGRAGGWAPEGCMHGGQGGMEGGGGDTI